jgi:anti-sigma B factor antagonist
LQSATGFAIYKKLQLQIAVFRHANNHRPTKKLHILLIFIICYFLQAPGTALATLGLIIATQLFKQGKLKMHLVNNTVKGIEFITLPERLMMADTSAFRSQLKNFTSKHQPKLALDLSQLVFIDSNGLAALVGCLKIARRNSGNLCLFGMREEVRVLFELTRLNKLFPIVNHHDEALRVLA